MNNSAAYQMKETPAMEDGELSGAIHTTLPLEQLIELVESEIRELIPYDSFEYANPENSTHLFFGAPQLHRCQYRIFIGPAFHGTITVSRRTPFNETEIGVLEGALGALIIHLNNALSYQADLSEDDLTDLRIDRAYVSMK